MQQWNLRPMFYGNIIITSRRMRRNYHDEDFCCLLLHVQNKNGTNLSFIWPVFVGKIRKPDVTRFQQLQQQIFVQL